MYKILSKYNIITVVPFEETFFYTTELPKNIKFSQDLIKFNYLKYSPYKNPSILNIVQDKKLLIWYQKEKVNSSIVIPESYVLYKELCKNTQDAIYIIKDNLIKILVIKNTVLLSSFVIDNIDEDIIKLTMDEFQISKIVNIETQEYMSLKTKALAGLSIKDFLLFNQLKLDRKTLMKTFVNKASYPIAALTVFSMFVSYMNSNILESEINELNNIYTAEKIKNKEIKKYIKKHNSQVKIWKEFVSKELVFVGPIILLDNIYEIFKEGEKAYLMSISINATKMNIKIQTDLNPVEFLNRLNEIKYFSRVVIQNTRKPRNNLPIISYDIDVKMIKDL